MIGTIGHESEPKEKARKDRGGGSAPVSPIYRSPVSTGEYISLTRRIEESLVNPFVALNPRAIPPSFLFLSFLLPSFNLPPLPSPVSRLNCFLELPFASSQRRRQLITGQQTAQTRDSSDGKERSEHVQCHDAIRPQTLPATFEFSTLFCLESTLPPKNFPSSSTRNFTSRNTLQS